MHNFVAISYPELLRRHTTSKGISPTDGSVYVVVGTYSDDIFTDDGDTLRYSQSIFDHKANGWLDSQVGKNVKVYLNLKYERVKYYFCGEYMVHPREDSRWTLRRVGRAKLHAKAGAGLVRCKTCAQL